MAGWDNTMFGNLPGPPLKGSPKRPKFPDDNRSLAQTMFPVDPRAVVGGLYDQATEGAGNLVAGGARRVGLPDPDLLGHDVTAFMQSPTFGGGMSPMAGAGALAAAPLVGRASRGARTAEEIATGARTADASDAAVQAARAAKSTPAQNALDRLTQPSAPSAEEAATGARRALVDAAPDIRRMPVDQGIQQAQTEAHLIPARGGGYVGGPPDVQNYADLQARRAQVDDYIARNIGGADWYERARGGIDQASGGDADMANWLAHLHGSLSAGVSPESETAFAIKEAVSRAAGEPAVAHWGAQSRAIDRAIAANDPSLMQFGGKTGEYERSINPTVPQDAPSATGVNDFRQFKLWGYPGRGEGVDPSAGATRHRFMDYETALSVDRANKANLGGKSDWIGQQVQAIPWVTQKSEDLDIPFEEAAKSGPDFYPKHAAAATYEQQPGAMFADKGWHLPGSVNMTADERTAYAADDPWTDASGRDVIYGGGRIGGSGLGVPTLPTLPAVGVWKDETNPARIAQPVMPFDVSTKENPIPGAPLGTKSLPPYAQNFLKAGEMVRSTFGAQEGGGAHKLWAKQAPGAQNAVFVPLDRPATRAEIDDLSKAGEQFGLPNVTSTSGGLAVLNYDGAPKLSTKDRSGLLEAIGAAKPDDAGDHVLRRADTVYAGPNWTTPGAGTATRSMLDAIGVNPGMQDFFASNAGIGQAAGALARRDEAAQIGGQGRDFWNLRNLAAANGGQGWAERLNQALTTGKIPATVAGVGGATVALYPEAGLPATPPQQGTSLNSPPGWLQQYWNGGL